MEGVVSVLLTCTFIEGQPFRQWHSKANGPCGFSSGMCVPSMQPITPGMPEIIVRYCLLHYNATNMWEVI